ncbi:MAG: acylphosphatase [Candidatus Aenigmarchaeota archaeon]|nr:acylphosphatase [Candidatus Aenigmarchaeota archaeon]
MEEKVRVRAWVSGIVQGVFYRSFVEYEANHRNLKGYVRNLADGRVEVLVEGERGKIKDLLGELKNYKDYGARVDSIDVEYGDFKGEFEDFRIKRFRGW